MAGRLGTPDRRPAETLVDRGGTTYRLIAQLGEGGFGVVYLAQTHTAGGLPRRVALKLLRGQLDPRSHAAARMRDEAMLLARLEHPAILTAHDLVDFDGRLGLVTEYVEGQDLSACLEDPVDPMPVPALLEAVGQVAAALDTAWTRLRMVHRDIKPGNVRIGRHGNVKLLDFGIARSGEVPRAARTRTHAMIGTLPYLAPERFQPGEPASAADVFALGCVLYEGLWHRAMFDGEDLVEAVGLAVRQDAFEAHVRGRLGAAPRAPLPDGLAELVGAMLGFHAADRPSASAVCDVAERLARAASGKGLQAWCRARAWPEVAELPPVLGDETSFDLRPAGPSASPDTLALTAAGSTSAPPPAPSTRPTTGGWGAIVAGGAAGLSLFAVGGTLALGSAIAVAIWLGSTPEVAPPAPAGPPLAPIAAPAPPAAPAEPAPGPPPRPGPPNPGRIERPPEPAAPVAPEPPAPAPAEPEPAAPPPPVDPAPVPGDAPATDVDLVLVKAGAPAKAVQVNCRSGFFRRADLVDGWARIADVPSGQSCVAYLLSDDAAAASHKVSAGDQLVCTRGVSWSCDLYPGGARGR